MDELLKKILTEKSGDLIGVLTGNAGYSTEQAKEFLPEAGSALGPALQSQASKLDLANLASAANVSSLLGAIDIGALASRVGLSREQSAAGLSALLPRLLGFLADQGGDAGGLLGMLGKAGEAGEALDKLKGLGGKLFR